MPDQDEGQLRAIRRAKVDRIRESGQDPYPNDFRQENTCGEVNARYEGMPADRVEAEAIRFVLAGRATALRDFGNAVFLDLADRTGKLQLFLSKKVVGPEVLKHVKKTLDVGDIVGVAGTPFITRTGELTLNVQEFRILVKSLQALPEKWHGLTHVETRLRQRYLDLIANPKVRETFRRRSAVIESMRAFLKERGFLEVETPMMQPIPGGAAARPFVTHHNTMDMDLYLRIAPELYLKRLLVGGFERVFEINRNFRNEGVSIQHNPEFTMLEFYQAYATFEDLMDLTEQMIARAATDVCGGTRIEYGGNAVDFAAPWPRMRMEEIVPKHTDIPRDGTRDLDALRTYADKHEIPFEKEEGWGSLLTRIFDKSVEHRLEQPTFVTHYPVEISPLARRNAEDPEVVDRFELFIAGREIANAFSELNDPEDQRARFEQQARARVAGDEEAHQMDEDFVRALEYGMPPAAGEGVGIDRLVMLLTDSASIRDVILFPLLRREAGG